MTVSLGDLTPNNIKQLKVLNSIIFPYINLSDKYYEECLNKVEFSQFGYFKDVNVGAVSFVEEDDQSSIEIKTIGVLQAYRRLGVASKLLEYVFDKCKENDKIKEIKVLVQTTNEAALNLFKKFGFEEKDTVKDYYDNLDKDRNANVLKKN